MRHRYKRSDDGPITAHKARYTVGGDRMQPYTHSNPEPVTTYTAERRSIRTIMCFTAFLNVELEQCGISYASLHEQYELRTPVNVHQLPRLDGAYKHPCKIGKLVGNL